MEPNFQTSFIPKKPIVQERVAPARFIGFFPIISIFILFIALLISLALYFYKGVLTKDIAQMENTLTLAKNRFESSKIIEFELLDKSLRASSEILSRHIAVTPIFQALSLITMKTVRYTKFSYELGSVASSKNGNEKNTKVFVKMSGIAVGYRSIALQADLFSSKDIGKNFIQPVFSNLTLDDKGNVAFDLEFSVDPSFVDYKQTLLTQS